jgi:hypothetical protein
MSAARSLLAAALLGGAVAATSVPAAAQPITRRDLVTDANVWLEAPPLPADYVEVRRGAIAVAYPRAMAPLAAPILDRAEEDERALRAQLGIESAPTIHVRVVPDIETLRALAPRAAPPPAYAVGVAYPTISLALVSVRQHDQGATPSLHKVFRHELAHVMLGLATNQAPVPRWFAEGLAIEQAAERTFERMERLAMASFTGGLVPWGRLDAGFSEEHGDVDVAYAQSADVVNWMIRLQGPARLPVLTMHLREGVAFEDAVRETWGRSLSGMEPAWRDDARLRFTLAPLWSGGFLGLAGTVLTFAAVLRRRRRAKRTLDQWAREDRARMRPRFAVISPGLSPLRVIRGGADENADGDGDEPSGRTTLH